ncbi:MAG: CarD family transcriptional regulator [Oscillospiraceae bacterium]|nr:CarD family transcriptional regulator [Oscillospiraceae bacterium]
MLAVGSMVMYGKNGVCRVNGIVEKKVGKNTLKYYVLQPAYKNGLTFFVPVGQESALNMQQVLSAEEIHELILRMPTLKEVEIEDERERRDEFEAMLAKGDRDDLIRIIKTIYKIRGQRQSCGKKLCAKDEQIYAQAQKMLYNEFAVVLDIDPDQVVPMIIDAIEA